MYRKLLTKKELTKITSTYDICDPEYEEAFPYFDKIFTDLTNTVVMPTVRDKLEPYLKEFSDYVDARTEVLDYTWKTSKDSYFPKVKAQH